VVATPETPEYTGGGDVLKEIAVGEGYVLGHQAEELARLDGQSAMLAPATRLAFQLAGIGPGMRVLDLGTGTGEVALLAAEAVGPAGSVVGVDQSAEVLAYAAAKCADREVTNIELVEADVATYVPSDPVDACVGRLVLSYLPDPVATIRRLLGSLTPEGVYLALEYDTEAVRGAPPTPLVTRLSELMNAAFAAVGTPQTLGPHLARMLRSAGAADAQSLGLQAYLDPEDPTGPAMLAGVIGSLVPAIAAHGLADPAALDVPTLRERVAAEVREAGSAVIVPTLVAAWGHPG
jgi:ubiquinone/menaquinone biosynthesis C-methylase UbiE